jgi:hypothetical protein
MDGKTMAAVALRVWALVLLLGVITSIPGTVMVLGAVPYPPEAAGFIRTTQLASLIESGVTAALALSLLLWGDLLARRAIPHTPTLAVGLDAAQLLAVGATLVGVYVGMRGIAEVTGVAYVVARRPDQVTGVPYLWENQSRRVIAAAVDIVLGVLLVLGRDGIAATWARLRSVRKNAG